MYGYGPQLLSPAESQVSLPRSHVPAPPASPRRDTRDPCLPLLPFCRRCNLQRPLNASMNEVGKLLEYRSTGCMHTRIQLRFMDNREHLVKSCLSHRSIVMRRTPKTLKHLGIN